MKELIKYEDLTQDKQLLEKANLLRETIQKELPEGDTAYKLLGFKNKVVTYPMGVTKIGKFTKAEKETNARILSLEEMTKNQIGLFGNLNNLQSLNFVKDLAKSFVVTDDPTKPDAKLLLMISEKTDSLGRKIIERYGVYFRPYTREEMEEYIQRQNEKEAEEFTGNDSNLLKMNVDF